MLRTRTQRRARGGVHECACLPPIAEMRAAHFAPLVCIGYFFGASPAGAVGGGAVAGAVEIGSDGCAGALIAACVGFVQRSSSGTPSSGTIRSATMLMILISGLTAG